MDGDGVEVGDGSKIGGDEGYNPVAIKPGHNGVRRKVPGKESD